MSSSKISSDGFSLDSTRYKNYFCNNIGSSKPEQMLDSIKALDNTSFTKEELKKIGTILK